MSPPTPNYRNAKAAFLLQQDQSHCGATCLAILLRYWGAEPRLQRLLEQSGTDTGGSSLLGLQLAAADAGLLAEGYEADIESLRDAATPSILHVVGKQGLLHFVLCLGWQEGRFLIADPAIGVDWREEHDLEQQWLSKRLLLVEKGPSFVTAVQARKHRIAWLRDMLQEDYNILGVALALGIAVTLLSMAQAVFVQKLLDDILPNKHTAKLGVGLGLLGFLLLMRAGFGLLRSRFLIQQSRAFNNRLVGHFFSALLHLPKSFFDSRRTGDLIARLNDTLRIQNTVSYLASSLMIDVLLTLMCLGFMLYYDVILFAIAAALLPLFLVVVRLHHRSILTGQRDMMAAYARNESHYVDVIQAIWPIKVGNREQHYAQTTKSIYDAFQTSVMALGNVGMRFNFWTELATSGVLVALLSTGAMLQLQGNIEIGGLIAVVYLLQMMLPAAGRLAVVNIQLQEARVAFDRMQEFSSIEPEYRPEQDQTKASLVLFESLRLRQLQFGFPGQEDLITGIDMDFKAGGSYAIFGESGAGKSTLMQILQGFYRPTGGELLVNGKQMSEVSIQSWRNLLGVVPQQVRILSGTLAENIALDAPDPDPAHWQSFLGKYGFDKYFARFPQGLATRVGEDGVKLSGGQQQLVALARALYREPQLLLLDEGTAAMDRNTEDFVLQLLRQLRGKMTVLVVSHRIRSIRDCDKIYVIDKGQVAAHGTHHTLLEGQNLYRLSWADFSG